MSFIRQLFFYALVLAVMAVFVYVCNMGYSSYQRVKSLQAQRDGLEESVGKLRAQIADYKHRQDRFQTDAAYVERVAREQGRVVPNEIVFKVE